MEHQKILENRFGFLACHREKRESFPEVELFHGKFPFFKNAFLFEKIGIKKIPDDYQLHLLDWVSIDDGFLNKNKWAYSESMNYMVLKNGPEKWKVNPKLTIEKITGEKDMARYCQTQSRGFREGSFKEDDFYPYILASFTKHLYGSNHHFYLASLDGNPAGVSLAFFTGDLAGIYSVATAPEYRKIGVSTSLMKVMVGDVLEHGAGCIALQTMAGSYAESFYTKLGFGKAYECRIFKKQI